MTTQNTSAKTIKLSRETLFSRLCKLTGQTVTKELPAGKSVSYYTQQTATEVVHVAEYIDSDNVKWLSEVRKAISAPTTPSAPAVVPAVNLQSAAMAVHTAAIKTASKIYSTSDDATVQEKTHVQRLAKIADTLSGDIYQINYYIPVCLNDTVDNPSRIFRRHGFRLDGSNWVFPADGLAHKDVQDVLNEWNTLAAVNVPGDGLAGYRQQGKVRYWIIKYTKEQVAEMRDLALSQLADELIKTHRSLINRIDSAAKDLEEARKSVDEMTDKERATMSNVYHGRLRASIVEAQERFAMCLKGAELFDDTGSLDALFDAVQDAIATQTIATNAILRKNGVKQVAPMAS